MLADKSLSSFSILLLKINLLAACTKTLICIIIVVRDQNGATGNLKSELGLSVGSNRLACLWKQAVKIHYDPLSS